MKKAYVVIHPEMLSDLLNISPRIKSVEMVDDLVRLNLEGDGLPDTCSDIPKQVKLEYTGLSFPIKGLNVKILEIT